MKRILVAVCFLCLSFTCATAQPAKQPLTNAEVISMLDAKLPESTIILAIQNSESNFDTSPQSLILLKNKGATANILDIMINSAKGRSVQNAPGPAPATARSRIKMDHKIFTFELADCRIFGTRIKCEFMVTNNSQDTSLEIQGRYYDTAYTRMIDDAGNEYKASRVQLGTNESTSKTKAMLVQGVPFKLIIIFDDIPQNTTTLKLLDISVDYDGMDYNDPNRNVQFRNVPLTISTPRTDEKIQRVFKNEFSFDLVSCQKTGKLLKCIVSMKNNEASERKIGMALSDKRYSRIIDGEGLERVPFEGGLTNNVIKPGPFGPVFSYSVLTSGASTNIVLSFDDAENVSSVKLLRLYMGYRSPYGGISEEFDVDFRDVSVK